MKKKLTINEFVRMHKKEIMAWQKWLQKQSGKTIDQIDWASEPKMPKMPNK